jgi:hypothetical protein
MPWAVWLVVTLLIAMVIPRLAPSVAGYVLVFTNFVTQSLEKLVAAALAGRMSEPAGSPPLWRQFGWSGVVWLATIVVLAVGIVIRRYTGHSGRGLTNLLFLMVSWPVCFQLAKRAAPGAAPR